MRVRGRGPGQATMFNLPRFQTPGTSLNFNSGFGEGGGFGPGSGSLRFSVTRTASSDPVQNILNDIGNPLGGVNLSLGGQGAPQAPRPGPLRDRMVDQPSFGPPGFFNGQFGDMGRSSTFMQNVQNTGFLGGGNPIGRPTFQSFGTPGGGFVSRTGLFGGSPQFSTNDPLALLAMQQGGLGNAFSTFF